MSIWLFELFTFFAPMAARRILFFHECRVRPESPRGDTRNAKREPSRDRHRVRGDIYFYRQPFSIARNAQFSYIPITLHLLLAVVD